MRILIVGLGSIGRRHLANLKLIQPTARAVIWHQHTKEKAALEIPLETDKVVYNLEEALNTLPDAALITNPASLHIETSLTLARQGIHLFIEKPLSNSMNGVDELIDLCHKRSLILMVGYNLRFYRPLQVMRQALIEGQIGRPVVLRAEVGQYLPEWRPGRDYRHTTSAKHVLGGGAVLELSHELDYARWLLGEVKTVHAQIEHLSDLEIDVEDVAEIILQFSNGGIGNIHLDMIQQPATRICRVIGTKGTLIWDGLSHRVQLYRAGEGMWRDLHPETKIDRNEMYVTELRHFLECVNGDKSPSVNGEEGRRVMEVALAVKRSSRDQKVVAL